MNDSPDDSRYRKRTPAQRAGGGQPGNTNGRTHGWFSKASPPPVEELRAAADAVIGEGNIATLKDGCPLGGRG